jgi:hypothetical protein
MPRRGHAMFGRLFPRQLDNAYRGHWLALVILALLLVLRLVQTGLGLVDPVLVIRGPDGILFDTFNGPGQAAFASLFRLVCLFNLVVCLLGVLAMVRYRAMVPLIYLVLIVSFGGRKILGLLDPIPRAPDAPGVWMVFAMIAAALLGFLLSLLDRRNTQPG